MTAYERIDAAVDQFGGGNIPEDTIAKLVTRLMDAKRATGLKGLPGEVFSSRDMVQIIVTGYQELQ